MFHMVAVGFALCVCVCVCVHVCGVCICCVRACNVYVLARVCEHVCVLFVYVF